MKNSIVLALMLFSLQAFGLSFSCEDTSVQNAFERISLTESGSLVVQGTDFKTRLAAGQVHVFEFQLTIEGVSEDSTDVTLIVNGVPTTEGYVTMVFAYDPAKKAGRLTYLLDGQYLARDLLLTNCKGQ